MDETEPGVGKHQALVIGDFFVDENWSLVSHESALSTFSAPAHLSSPSHRSTALHQWPAAAGLVAMELLQQGFSVGGLGAWNHADEDLLTALILAGRSSAQRQPDSPEGGGTDPPIMAPYILQAPRIEPARDALRLYNLARQRPEVGTTRVFRLYRRLASEPPLELDRRVDFELPLPEELRDQPTLECCEGGPYRYVVVKDLHRGIASTALLKALHKDGWVDGNTSWYISSSQPQPKWVRELLDNPQRYGGVRLAILPAGAVSRAMVIDDASNEWVNNPAFAEYWFAAGGHPTVDALRVLAARGRRGYS